MRRCQTSKMAQNKIWPYSCWCGSSDFALNTLHLFNNKEFPIRWSIIHIYMTIEEKNCFAKKYFVVWHFWWFTFRHRCAVIFVTIDWEYQAATSCLVKYLHRSGGRWQVSVVATFTLVATSTCVQPSLLQQASLWCNLHFGGKLHHGGKVASRPT